MKRRGCALLRPRSRPPRTSPLRPGRYEFVQHLALSVLADGLSTEAFAIESVSPSVPPRCAVTTIIAAGGGALQNTLPLLSPEVGLASHPWLLSLEDPATSPIRGPIKRPDRHVAFLNAGQHGSLARTSRTLLPSLAVAFPARGGGIARPARARPGSVDPHGRQRRPDDSGTPGSDRRGGKPIGVVDAEAVSELGRGAPTVAVSAPLRPSTPASSTITRVLSAPPSVTVRRPVAAQAASARAARAPSVFRLRLP
jgi:hypothetical protein